MKVGIIGAGAVGLLYAFYLSNKHDVTIYTRRKEQANAINEKGITLNLGNQQWNENVRAVQFDAGDFEEDILLVAVKQYHLDHVLPHLKKNAEEKIDLLFLQNGMGHINKIRHLPQKNISLGVVEHGALKKDDTTVVHTGVGKTVISSYRGEGERINHCFQMINTNSFPFELFPDWYEMLAKKLVVNAVINPLTALYRVENGELVSNPFFYKSMEQLFHEVISVIDLEDHQHLWKYVIEICKKTGKNRSSMLRDIENSRQTEVEAIMGYLLHEAEVKNRALPLTKFLYESIKGLERKK
jgi:2-dehydropantoate 2-reductase